MRRHFVVGLMVLFTGTFLVAGDPEGWQEIVNKDKNFKVKLPKKEFKEETRNGNLVLKGEAEDGIGYRVDVLEYKEGAVKGKEDEEFDAILENFTKDGKYKLLKQRKWTVNDKHLGRDFQLEGESGGQIFQRMVAVEDRIYMMSILGGKDTAKSKDGKFFLLSFDFLEPN